MDMHLQLCIMLKSAIWYCVLIKSHLNDDVVILNHQRVWLDVAREWERPARFITSLGPARHILTICGKKNTHAEDRSK